jgi:hypothetical protein
MIIELGLITGLMLGFEYSGPIDEDDEHQHLLIDILFVRFMCHF